MDARERYSTLTKLGRAQGRAVGLAALLLGLLVSCAGAAPASPDTRAPASQPAAAAPPAATPAPTGPTLAATGPTLAATPAAPTGAGAPLRPAIIGIPAVSASALVQYVGLDHGFYAQHGFQVDIQQLRSNIAPAALMSKQIDYFAGADSQMRAAIAGLPIKVVSVTRNAPTFGIVAKPGIERVPDLRGKVVGTTSATGSSVYGLKRTLEAFGMTLNDVQVLPGGDAPVTLQNLTQGLIDAAMLAAPQVFVAQDSGFPMRVYVPDHVQFASNGLAVSDEALRERPEEIQRLIAAEIAIVAFAQQNREQTVATLVGRLGVSPEQASRTYDFEVPAYTTDPRLSRADVEASIQEELEAGHITAPVPPEQAVAFGVAEAVVARAR